MMILDPLWYRVVACRVCRDYLSFRCERGSRLCNSMTYLYTPHFASALSTNENASYRVVSIYAIWGHVSPTNPQTCVVRPARVLGTSTRAANKTFIVKGLPFYPIVPTMTSENRPIWDVFSVMSFYRVFHCWTMWLQKCELHYCFMPTLQLSYTLQMEMILTRS